MNDFRFAIRQLLKNPGFTMIAVLTLALGIGANTAVFSIINGVLLKPLPYEQPGQLVQVWEAPRPGQRNSASPGAFADWREQSTSFEGLSLVSHLDLNLARDGKPEQLNGISMSANGLALLGTRPILGRTFAPDEDQPGKDKVVILAYGLWQQHFGGATNIVSQTLSLSGERYTIIGVLPPQFVPWETAKFVVPRSITLEERAQRGANYLGVVGRLKSGVSVEQANAELNTIAQRLKSLYPAWKKDWGVTVVPMHEQITGDIRPTLLILLGAVGLVLLIACANVANLLLSKASARQREMVIRSALGASRWQVIRQLLVESVLLSVTGGLLGLFVAFWSINALTNLTAVNLPRAREVNVDLTVLGFALAVSIITGLVFGLAPALQASRPDLNETLKESGRAIQGGTRNRVRSGLIVTEVALALMLLIGAGLLLNSFVRLTSVEPGFNPQNILTMQISVPEKKYPDPDRRAIFFAQVLEGIEQTVGVEAAGFTTALPLARWPHTTTFSIVGQSGHPDSGYLTDFDFCTPDYFRAMGIPLLKGRLFEKGHQPNTAREVIVTESLAREYFANEEPLGKRIHLDVFLGKNSETWEIVGVAGDVRRRGLGEKVAACVYRPQAFNSMSSGSLVVRSTGAPAALIEGVRKAILAVDADQPVSNIRTGTEVIAASVAQRRLIMGLLSGFAGGALILAAMGLYGVISYAIVQRTREIGVRMALGANRADVLGLVLRDGVKLTGIGIVLGVAGALALSRILAQLLYEIRPSDPLTFATVALIFIVVATLASWLPARRAAKVDPMIALRSE